MSPPVSEMAIIVGDNSGFKAPRLPSRNVGRRGGRGSRPSSKERGSRPTSVDRGSRPSSSERGGGTRGSAAGSRPASKERSSRPTSVDRGSRPASGERGGSTRGSATVSRPATPSMGEEALAASNPPEGADTAAVGEDVSSSRPRIVGNIMVAPPRGDDTMDESTAAVDVALPPSPLEVVEGAMVPAPPSGGLSGEVSPVIVGGGRVAPATRVILSSSDEEWGALLSSRDSVPTGDSLASRKRKREEKPRRGRGRPRTTGEYVRRREESERAAAAARDEAGATVGLAAARVLSASGECYGTGGEEQLRLASIAEMMEALDRTAELLRRVAGVSKGLKGSLAGSLKTAATHIVNVGGEMSRRLYRGGNPDSPNRVEALARRLGASERRVKQLEAEAVALRAAPPPPRVQASPLLRGDTPGCCPRGDGGGREEFPPLLPSRGSLPSPMEVVPPSSPRSGGGGRGDGRRGRGPEVGGEDLVRRFEAVVERRLEAFRGELAPSAFSRRRPLEGGALSSPPANGRRAPLPAIPPLPRGQQVSSDGAGGGDGGGRKRRKRRGKGAGPPPARDGPLPSVAGGRAARPTPGASPALLPLTATGPRSAADERDYPVDGDSWATVAGRRGRGGGGRARAKPGPRPSHPPSLPVRNRPDPRPSLSKNRDRRGSAPAGRGGNPSNRGPPSRKRRVPNTAAVVISFPPGEMAEAMQAARSKIDLVALGLPQGFRIGHTRTGALSLEVAGEDRAKKADELAVKLREVLSDRPAVRVARPVKMAELRVAGLVLGTPESDVADSVAREGGCLPADVKVGPVRRGRRGLWTVWVRCPLVAANRVAAGRWLTVAWAKATVEPLSVQPLRCFRCLQVGHVRAECSGADRSSLCHRCGVPGHIARNCEATPNCAICAEAGRPSAHRVGGSSPCRRPPKKKGGRVAGAKPTTLSPVPAIPAPTKGGERGGEKESRGEPFKEPPKGKRLARVGVTKPTFPSPPHSSLPLREREEMEVVEDNGEPGGSSNATTSLMDNSGATGGSHVSETPPETPEAKRKKVGEVEETPSPPPPLDESEGGLGDADKTN